MLRRSEASAVRAYLQTRSRIVLALLVALLCLLLVLASHSVVSAYYRVLPEPADGGGLFQLPDLQVAQNNGLALNDSLTRVYVISYVSVTGPSLIDPTQPIPEQEVVFSDDTQ